LAGQVPLTDIGTAEKCAPFNGEVMAAGDVTGGPATFALTKRSLALTFKVAATKNTPAQNVKNINNGYGKKNRFLRLLICLDARFLVFWRGIFYFYENTLTLALLRVKVKYLLTAGLL
jgi:hypothetical protein